jgi:invasion protein IalB
MLRIFAIAALAGALLASGAYAPEAISAQTANVTVVKKNEAWPLLRQLEELCDLSTCQDV